METLSGRQESAPCSSLLDTKAVSARKRAKRAYHRVMSGMHKDHKCRMMTLTTAFEVENDTMQRDFRRLYMRLQRRGLIRDYIRVKEYTQNGKAHLHVIFRGSYIEQQYLSKLWEKIHGSPVVDIRRCRGKRGVASYLAKYMAKDLDGRLSWSWGWVWKGFCKDWKRLKAYSREWAWSFNKLLTNWQYCCYTGMKPTEVLPP